MLNRDEIAFLQSQNLTAGDVYDGRKQAASAWKAGVRAAGLTVVLGTPCHNGGHRLRTRSGHCAQCDTSKLSYQKRHHSPGYVYIAGSRSAMLLKVGTTIDIEQRTRNLRNQAYGGFCDWVMLFTAKVANGGKTEGEAIRRLKAFRVLRTYAKDGSQQEAAEMLRTSFTKAINAVAAAMGKENSTELWKSPQWRDFEF
ncbi:GIY-YIG nuclease family protein [Mesorhizobium australicum]|uniref:GIY-YIG nuclease family protein n=1 Tax=Mesorhizobium australicum TaxID=536018 RepID=UPI00333DE06A